MWGLGSEAKGLWTGTWSLGSGLPLVMDLPLPPVSMVRSRGQLDLVVGSCLGL